MTRKEKEKKKVSRTATPPHHLFPLPSVLRGKIFYTPPHRWVDTFCFVLVSDVTHQHTPYTNEEPHHERAVH
jgi:hypothetical protein